MSAVDIPNAKASLVRCVISFIILVSVPTVEERIYSLHAAPRSPRLRSYIFRERYVKCRRYVVI